MFTVEPKDAPWYRHFADEAERLWEDGTPWPDDPEWAEGSLHRI
ncbi:hypothetical protein [Amycolatopsis sp. w19]